MSGIKKGNVLKGSVLPDAVRVRVDCRGKMATFLYEETFTCITGKKRDGAIQAAVEAIVRVADDRVKVRIVGGKTIRMSGTVERTQVGDMLAGEFFCWGSASEMTFREMLLLSVMARAANVKHHRQVMASKPAKVPVPKPPSKRSQDKLQREWTKACVRLSGCTTHPNARPVNVGTKEHPYAIDQCPDCWALKVPISAPGVPPDATFWSATTKRFPKIRGKR